MRKLTLVSLALIAANAAFAQDAKATIDRAIAAWKTVTTARATFEQTITNSITGSDAASRGSMQQAKPDRLAIVFTDPRGDRIVADGKFVWVYLASATPGQVLRTPVAQAAAGNLDLIGQFLDSPGSKYDATVVGEDTLMGRKVRVLELVTRRGQDLPFTKAKIWVDNEDSMIRQFQSEEGALTRRVRITSLSLNATVDSTQFVFRVPRGVRVIEPGR